MTTKIVMANVKPEVIDRVKTLHADGWKKAPIARHLQISEHIVTRILDPQRHIKYTENKRVRERTAYKKRTDRLRSPQAIIPKPNHNPLYDPQRDGSLFHTNITAAMFGDPLPGRSVLDKLKLQEKV